MHAIQTLHHGAKSGHYSILIVGCFISYTWNLNLFENRILAVKEVTLSIILKDGTVKSNL